MSGITRDGPPLDFRDLPRASKCLLLVLGVVLCIPFSIRLPVGDSLVVLGQLSVGPAVITVGDVYLAAVTVGLVLYHREIWIPRSVTVAAMLGFIGALLGSALVNGPTPEAVVEILQWVEMGVLAILVATLLSKDWQRRRVLITMVYVATAKAVWTLVYFVQFGYPGRRFGVFVEGAAIVILVALIAEDGYHRTLVGSAPILLAAVLIGQERKVWVSIAAALSVVVLAYLVQNRLSRARLFRFGRNASIAVGVGIVASLLFAPDEIFTRLFTLLSLVPGLGGSTTIERLYLLETGLRMFVDNPLFGVGPENWFEAKNIYATDQLLAYEQKTDNDLGPHSLLVKTLAETGIIGVTLLGIVLLRPLKLFGWYLRSPDGRGPLLAFFGLFVYVFGVAALRSGGFVVRVYLFLILGIVISFELSGVGFAGE